MIPPVHNDNKVYIGFPVGYLPIADPIGFLIVSLM